VPISSPRLQRPHPPELLPPKQQQYWSRSPYGRHLAVSSHLIQSPRATFPRPLTHLHLPYPQFAFAVTPRTSQCESPSLPNLLFISVMSHFAPEPLDALRSYHQLSSIRNEPTFVTHRVPFANMFAYAALFHAQSSFPLSHNDSRKLNPLQHGPWSLRHNRRS
jgi:hypothetical protein